MVARAGRSAAGRGQGRVHRFHGELVRDLLQRIFFEAHIAERRWIEDQQLKEAAARNASARAVLGTLHATINNNQQEALGLAPKAWSVSSAMDDQRPNGQALLDARFLSWFLAQPLVADKIVAQQARAPAWARLARARLYTHR